MPLVRVGTKHQVVIPKAVFSKLGLAPGDYVDISVRRNRAVLTRKKLVDAVPTTDEPTGPKSRAALRRSLKEIKDGKGRGPFKSPKELIADLRRNSRRSKSK